MSTSWNPLQSQPAHVAGAWNTPVAAIEYVCVAKPPVSSSEPLTSTFAPVYRAEGHSAHMGANAVVSSRHTCWYAHFVPSRGPPHAVGLVHDFAVSPVGRTV